MGLQFSSLGTDSGSLINAIIANQIEVVRQHISKGIDVNKCDDKGNYPLYTAFRLNDVPIMELLLQSGAEATWCDADGISLLQLALLSGRGHAVKLLLRNGADINAQPESVTFESCNNLTDFLLKRAPDFNIAKTNFPTVLQFAMLFNTDMAVKLCFRKGFPFDPNARNPDGDNVLKKAVDSNSLKIVWKLIRLGADINATNAEGTILYQAVRKANLDMVRLLLDRGASPNFIAYGKIPLISAISFGQVRIVQLLLERGANANVEDLKGNTPLDWIFYKIRKFGERRRRGAVRRNINDPAHIEIKEKYTKIINLLFKYRANVHQQDVSGKTVLHRICKNGDLQSVRLLFEKTIDIDSYCNKNCDFWHRQDKEVCNIIQLQLPDKNLLEEKNALHYNIKRTNLFRHLREFFSAVENDIDVNIRDKMNKTALHYAAEVGSTQIIRCLLTFRADVSSVDNNGCSALRNAVEYYDKNPTPIYLGAAKRIAEMIAIQETNGQDVYKPDLEIVNNDALRDYYANCKEEIRKMKEKKIVCEGSLVCFYDFLSQDIRTLGKLAKNTSMMLSLKSEKYKKEFPLYGNLLETRIFVAEVRKLLLQVGELSFQQIIIQNRLPKLPVFFIQEMLNYAKNIDLLNFAVAVTPSRYVIILDKLMYFF